MEDEKNNELLRKGDDREIPVNARRIRNALRRGRHFYVLQCTNRRINLHWNAVGRNRRAVNGLESKNEWAESGRVENVKQSSSLLKSPFNWTKGHLPFSHSLAPSRSRLQKWVLIRNHLSSYFKTIEQQSAFVFPTYFVGRVRRNIIKWPLTYNEHSCIEIQMFPLLTNSTMTSGR